MQGKIVIQKRLKHAVMNRPRRTALGNSELPFALPAGGPAPVLPRCRGSSSSRKPPASLPPSFCFLRGPRRALKRQGPALRRRPGSRSSRKPRLHGGLAPFSPVPARTGAEVGNETPAKGRFIVP